MIPLPWSETSGRYQKPSRVVKVGARVYRSTVAARPARFAMEIRLNGETRSVEDGLSVADLVASLGLGGRRVAVELNREILAREEHAATRLSAGDVVEVVQFVGGG